MSENTWHMLLFCDCLMLLRSIVFSVSANVVNTYQYLITFCLDNVCMDKHTLIHSSTDELLGHSHFGAIMNNVLFIQ